MAYHLALRGERDVLVVERDELTSGSTFHSAGLVGQLRADPTLTRMNMYSVALYREFGAAVGWTECGGLRLASSPERLAEIRRQISWARSVGLPLEEISAREAQDLFPLMSPDGVLGAAYLPTDGYLDPSQLCYALATAARAAGVRIAAHTRVTAIDVEGQRVRRVRTDRGDVECEVVVDCAGMYAAHVARLVGVRVPIVPMAHQYVVTEGFRSTPDALPTLRDPDHLVYFRTEVNGLVMGGYERTSAPWRVSATSYDDVPAAFNGRLLAEDWPRFEQIAENAQRRVPALADVGVRRLINGPEAFTPDNEFCLGETAVAGFFVAAGFCAHGIAGAGGVGRLMADWILDGRPDADVWHMDVNRFGTVYQSPAYTLARTVESYETYYDIRYPGDERQAGRPLRRSPVYGWHAAHGAVFGEKAAWERVNYYVTNANAGDATTRPHGWAGRNWSPAVETEHRATRERAAVFDESSFAKIAVTGADAAAFLDWVCDNRVARRVGTVTYAQALNDRGGIEADFTVTRVADDEFFIVTGTAFGSHDLAWLRRQARRIDAGVRLTDVTGQWVCYAVWGPQARDVLAPLTPADLSDDAFPFMTAQALTIGAVPVRALRVTYVGELGWELYAPPDYGAALWQTVWSAGERVGLCAGGYRAIESLRLEKGYRVWSTDVTPETTPYEAKLGFCVKLDKPGGFAGRDALTRDVSRRLACLVLDDPRQVVLGGEPIRVGRDIAGRVTSGGFGYTLRASIAYGYLPVECTTPGTRVEVDLFGMWIAATVSAEPLYDPRGTRVRM